MRISDILLIAIENGITVCVPPWTEPVEGHNIENSQLSSQGNKTEWKGYCQSVKPA